jgi:regulation of enolase protein 1 (concanavalin A-like superfamily)
MTMNLLQDIQESTRHVSEAQPAARSLQWEHTPPAWESLPGGGLRVHVPARVDYFQDPAGRMTKDDAPYLWLNVAGDFVARAHIRPGFTTTWDAGALMVRSDAQLWAKLCYESTDLGTTAAVSVVTQDKSDDANGADLNLPDLWLQVVRSGNVFSMHYALDGRHWRMVRLFSLPVPPTVRVGLVAQCPAGPGTTIDFLHFSVEPGAVKDMRAGV